MSYFQYITWLFLVLLCIKQSYGNHPCLCIYSTEVPVFKNVDLQSEKLGFLYQLDCVPVLDSTSSNNLQPLSYAVQYQNNIGYIENNPLDVLLDSCPGPGPTISLTSPLPPLTTTTATESPSVTTSQTATKGPSVASSHTTDGPTVTTPTKKSSVTTTTEIPSVTTTTEIPSVTSQSTTEIPSVTTTFEIPSVTTTIEIPSVTTSQATTERPTVTTQAATEGPSVTSTLTVTEAKNVTTSQTSTNGPTLTTRQTVTKGPTVMTSQATTNIMPFTTTLPNSIAPNSITTTNSILPVTTTTSSTMLYPPCPAGWKQYSATCYLFNFEEKANHTTATERCLEQNSHLIFIDSAREQNIVNILIDNDKQLQSIMSTSTDVINATTIWTGGVRYTTHHIWQWIDPITHTNIPFRYIRWEITYPRYDQANRDVCLGIVASKYNVWNDFYCDNKFFYICEKTSFSTPTLIG